MIEHSCPSSEYSEEFLRGMLDRAGVSFHKYGPVAEGYPFKVDAIASLKQRLRAYERTGNTEYLIDAANYAMFEFMHPAKIDARYEPTDSDGSTGRVSAGGSVTHASNHELE